MCAFEIPTVHKRIWRRLAYLFLTLFVLTKDAIKMYCLLNHGKVHTERASQAGTLPLRQASSGHDRNIKTGKTPSYPSPSTYSHFQQTPVWEIPEPEVSSAPSCFRASGGSFCHSWGHFHSNPNYFFFLLCHLYFYVSTLVVSFPNQRVLVNSISLYSHAILKPWSYLPSFSD